jgi:hypothetical protein
MKNFLTLLKPSGEMFAKETLARENVRGFVHSFRKTGSLEDLTTQETWFQCRVRISGAGICALSDCREGGQKLPMSQVKEAVSKVRVRGVNRWHACKYLKLASQITGRK